MDQHGDMTLEVLVDSQVAVENVSRLGRNSGYNTEVQENDDEYIIILNR
jgi:TusA-related sulfurtransferase